MSSTNTKIKNSSLPVEPKKLLEQMARKTRELIAKIPKKRPKRAV